MLKTKRSLFHYFTPSHTFFYSIVRSHAHYSVYGCCCCFFLLYKEIDYAGNETVIAMHTKSCTESKMKKRICQANNLPSLFISYIY